MMENYSPNRDGKILQQGSVSRPRLLEEKLDSKVRSLHVFVL
jgi:hypothetical protein